MDRFIGRSQELSALNSLYNKKGFQMAVVYGRRRVGKSTLIKEFIKGKKSVFWSAIRTSASRNLNLFTRQAMSVLSPETEGFHAENTQELFDFLGKCCHDERIVIVIDEFPYWADEDRSLTPVMQSAIDSGWRDGNMFLILCGSSVSFMEKEVLSEKSPLYGRRTAQLEIKPFKYWDAALFTPKYSAAEKSICYGITGGIPYYLSMIDDERSLDDNIRELFFTNHGYLYGEPSYLLAEEFTDVATYSAIIDAIAGGSNRPHLIADKTQMDASAVSHSLRVLMATGIVKKERAITDEKNKKKIQYVLRDNMFKFWYMFVPNAIPLIEMGNVNVYYDRIVKPKINEYMGDVFEEMCRDYTLTAGAAGKLNCFVTETGKWWGTNQNTRKETDIDVVGLSRAENKAVIGECKYRNEPLDKDVLDALMERDGLIDRKYKIVEYLLFSKSGFSKWITEHQSDTITPVSLDDMYSM